MKEIEEKAETGPNGILVIHPRGGGGLTAARLTTEFVLNIVQGLLLAVPLAWTGARSRYGSPVCFVTIVGLFGALATNVPYWNWYGFPANYTLAYIFTDVIGFLIVGVVVAALPLGKTTNSVAAAA